jgi:probable F420-dependent oxidoreductase
MKKIGLCLVNPAPQIESGFGTALAKKCEEMGLDSFWTIDRVAYDNVDSLTLLAAAAAVTKNLRLGTSVLLPGVRHPAMLAKIIASLDFLSGGRVTVGVGFGSRPNDFAAVEVPFEHRGSRAEEAVKLMLRLWTEDNVTHQGKFFKVANLTIGPRPIQSPHPPIWMGGSAESVLRRVGRMAQGYICSSSSVPELAKIWDNIAAAAKASGRDPGQIEKAGLTFMAIDNDKAKAIAAGEAYMKRYYGAVRGDVGQHFVIGPPEACAEKIRSIFTHGLQTLIIGTVIADLRQADLFGEKVLPLLKS